MISANKLKHYLLNFVMKLGQHVWNIMNTKTLKVLLFIGYVTALTGTFLCSFKLIWRNSGIGGCGYSFLFFWFSPNKKDSWKLQLQGKTKTKNKNNFLRVTNKARPLMGQRTSPLFYPFDFGQSWKLLSLGKKAVLDEYVQWLFTDCSDTSHIFMSIQDDRMGWREIWEVHNHYIICFLETVTSALTLITYFVAAIKITL